MKKITKIFFIAIIISIIGCHAPPSRESQDKDFFSFDQVINTSDRILKLSRNGNQISFTVDDINYTSFQFKVLKKIKGSSKKDDLIYITFTNDYLDDLYNALVEEYPDTFISGQLGGGKPRKTKKTKKKRKQKKHTKKLKYRKKSTKSTRKTEKKRK